MGRVDLAYVYSKSDYKKCRQTGLGVRYTNGPLYLTTFYEARADDDSAKPYTGAGNNGFGAKGWGIGGDKQTMWTVSTGIPVSSTGTIMLEYGQYKDYLRARRAVGNYLVYDK